MLRGVILLVFAFGACFARADTITDWNVIAFDTFKAANVGGNPLFRALAIMHVAASDAINTVENRYTRYALTVPLNASASADAAALAASRGVLIALAPSQKGKVDEFYAAALGRLPDGPPKTAGVTIAEQAAAAVIARACGRRDRCARYLSPCNLPRRMDSDLAAAVRRIRPRQAMGVCARGPIQAGTATGADKRRLRRDYNETKELGGAKSMRRTALAN
jgi:hypothetical protein